MRLTIRATIVAAALTLTLAGSAIAHVPGEFFGDVYESHCSSRGGAYGHGYLMVRARASEYGRNNANYLRLVSRWQQDRAGDDERDWVTVKKVVMAGPTFSNNEDDHQLDRRVKFSFTSEADFDLYWNRIRVTFEVWDQRPGADVRIWSETPKPRRC